jgi:hypothetical protein
VVSEVSAASRDLSQVFSPQASQHPGLYSRYPFCPLPWPPAPSFLSYSSADVYITMVLWSPPSSTLHSTCLSQSNPMLAMKSKDVYVPNDFTEHAKINFPDDLAAFKTFGDFPIGTKTYIDEKQAAHQVDMLLVGHYWLKRGGPSTWVCAAGTTVHYYYGNPFGIVCKPVQSILGNVSISVHLSAPWH